jgi:endo-1,3-1,4-beta-glycanase ExoK
MAQESAMRIWLLAAALSLAAWSAAAQDGSGQKTGTSFVDRFTTPLDSKRWYISHGWANGPHQNCTWIDTNVRVEGSVALALTDKPSADRPYTCAEIQTREFYGYGTYEVRMRSVAARGTVSAFFTFTGSPHGPQRPHDEIDFEFLGKSPTQVFLNYFAGGRKHEKYVQLPFDATAAANDFAFEWTAEGIRWFANGRLIREELASKGADLPTTPQKIYLSIWNGTGWDQEAWLGRFAYPGRPLVAVFERVAFTEPGAACQFPESVVCRKK